MKLLQSLLNPEIYGHPVAVIELLETHISWVILTGEYAYKIKKPVNLGFLDFSTLEKRCFYCNEEIRLNKRLAPQIYLQTVAFTGSETSPQINGSGPVLEYAVKMRQFRQQDQFDRLLEHNRLSHHDIRDLALLIAKFHQSARIVAADSNFGDAQHIYAPVEENYSQINTLVETDEYRKALQSLAHWSQSEFHRLQPQFIKRKNGGFVRECHGDMHLRNIAKYRGAIVVFDCIEFSDNLRWIDVISEIAFIEMDLHDRGRADYATILLNAYLQACGDYQGIPLLRFYLVYRAMVRAKVACIRAHQEGIEARERTETLGELSHYLNLANGFTRPEPPALLITSGFSGCGKTYVSDQLMEYMPFIRLRSDIERKRLFGLAADDNSHSPIDSGIYTEEASVKTYQQLAELSHCILTSQWSVLVDAAFLFSDQRQPFQKLAADLNIPFLILHFYAPPSLLLERVRERQQSKSDASEADVLVLESQISRQKPPDSREIPYILEIDSSKDIDTANLAQRIQHALKSQRPVKPR